MRRRRVDWDEELRKTEQIRKKGLFMSGLSFGVAAVFVFGASRFGESGIVIGRKVIAVFCLLLAMFVVRSLLRRRERLRLEREEREELE